MSAGTTASDPDRPPAERIPTLIDETAAPADPGGLHPRDAAAVSRALQGSLLPRSAPRAEGFDIAAGTTVEEAGLGSTVWDWVETRDGPALLALTVRRDGLPRAHHLGVARALARWIAPREVGARALLAALNDALAAAAPEGLRQFVDAGALVLGAEEVTWACSGRVPAALIHRDGRMRELGSHGPPLGMLRGFRYEEDRFAMGAGATVLVLSHAGPGLFRGAADLVAQLHGKPAGEIVTTLHLGIRRAMEGEAAETSVIYVRRH